MNNIKLIKSVVDKISFTKKGQIFYRDISLKGFGLRVGKSKKTYIAEKWVNGKSIRINIGTHGQVKPEQARKEAQRLLGEMAFGLNPFDQKKEKKAKGVTLNQAFLEYLDTRKSLKPRTIYYYKRTIEVYFNDWKNKSLINITKDMVVKRHRKIGDENGEAQANLAMRTLRAIYNFASGQYEDSKGKSIISENPVIRLSKTKAWYRIKRRQSVIKPYELTVWFQSVFNLKNSILTNKAEVVKNYLIFLLLTGLRRQEAARLKWKYVDLMDRTITITDTKNNEPLILPLSDYLLDMLKSIKTEAINEYVFPGKGDGFIVEPRRHIDKVIKESGIDFMLHDLRRTFITIAESLDIASYALKKLVNHKISGDVTSGYIIMNVERLREPMQKITDYILMKGEVT